MFCYFDLSAKRPIISFFVESISSQNMPQPRHLLLYATVGSMISHCITYIGNRPKAPPCSAMYFVLPFMCVVSPFCPR